jgi:hypothetical protein
MFENTDNMLIIMFGPNTNNYLSFRPEEWTQILVHSSSFRERLKTF